MLVRVQFCPRRFTRRFAMRGRRSFGRRGSRGRRGGRRFGKSFGRRRRRSGGRRLVIGQRF